MLCAADAVQNHRHPHHMEQPERTAARYLGNDNERFSLSPHSDYVYLCFGSLTRAPDMDYWNDRQTPELLRTVIRACREACPA